VAEVGIGRDAPRRRVIHTTDALPPGGAIMGNGFLGSHIVTIDWDNRAIHLTPMVRYSRDEGAGPGGTGPAAGK
jgi:hypothetical protein